MQYCVVKINDTFFVLNTVDDTYIGPYVEGKAWAMAARLNGFSSIAEYELGLDNIKG